MAIGRVAGPLLETNLDRQGVDLQISTNNQPLLYLDLENFKAAVNANARSSSETFTVVGNVKFANLVINGDTISSTTGNIHLGHVSEVKINGGLPNYIMTTDGSGNLSFQHIDAIGSELSINGGSVVLGDMIDGSLKVESAYRYWSANTAVTNAIDNLNQVMLNVYQNTYVGAVEFTGNVVEGPSPLTVQFTSTVLGNPDTYFWDFGDGNTSTDANPTHTYDNPLGHTYDVYFKASNVFGTKAGTGQYGDPHLAQGSYADLAVTDYITVRTPMPIPAFTLSQTVADSGTTIALINNSQFADSYEIRWGDGTFDLVTSNSETGGTNGPIIEHTYNQVGDHRYEVIVDAYSSTAVPGGVTVSSSPTAIYVYANQTPTFTSNKVTGNNQHNTVPNGLVVTFTNTTATSPGATSIFADNRYVWDWGDGTTETVLIGSNANGDTDKTIEHAFQLTDPKSQQIFNVTLTCYTGRSNSPFVSTAMSITVIPAPTSVFDAYMRVTSDKDGDTVRSGYLFTDLDGVNRALVDYTNSSFNSNTYQWSYGDGQISAMLNEGDMGTPIGATLTHTYLVAGTFDVSLLAHGSSSLTPQDDTLVKTGFIVISNPPAPPAGVSSKTLTITSVGNNALLAASATNNSTVLLPTAGTSVNRVTSGTVETGLITDAYNSFTGTLAAVINGATETPYTLTGGNDTGTYGSLVVTEDKDAHAFNQAIYPSRFYNLFSGKISRPNALVPVGHNTYQISHSDTGSTNVLSFIKDDVTAVPSFDITTVAGATVVPGTVKYVSGIPHFTSDGSIEVDNLLAFNWIGQTYLGSTTPLTVASGTVVEGVGGGVVSQGKTYANLQGAVTYLAGGIPTANTGKNSSSKYQFGSIPVSVNGTVASLSKLTVRLSNVNGNSLVTELPVKVNVINGSITGVDELSIPVNPTLGGAYSDNAKRIVITNSGANPIYLTATNYYVNHTFAGAVTVAGTDEAIVRFGRLAHNVVNYSSETYPVGPDLSGRGGTQYFRFAFRRSAVANFTITYSGKISGLWIASPGTAIDASSTLNGWLDGTLVYAGAGVPGANVVAGGNGSNGCAKSAGDVIPTFQVVTNHSSMMTLGSANSSDATGGQIFINIALEVGDYVTSISIS